MISLEYSKDNKSLINFKNRLRFNVSNNILKEYLTLQLEDALTPKKRETVDLKITNFAILATKELNNMKVVDEFNIEGFQNFQQYLTINPINIQITNPEIQNKLLCYANRYKYRLIANSLLFSSSIKKDTNVIFITTNGLNNAKSILING